MRCTNSHTRLVCVSIVHIIYITLVDDNYLREQSTVEECKNMVWFIHRVVRVEHFSNLYVRVWISISYQLKSLHAFQCFVISVRINSPTRYADRAIISHMRIMRVCINIAHVYTNSTELCKRINPKRHNNLCAKQRVSECPLILP